MQTLMERKSFSDCSCSDECRDAATNAVCAGRAVHGAMEGRGDARGLQNQAAINTAFPEAASQPH